MLLRALFAACVAGLAAAQGQCDTENGFVEDTLTGLCLFPVESIMCDVGYVREGATCVAEIQEVKCAEGFNYEWASFTCIEEFAKVTCEDGLAIVDGLCVPVLTKVTCDRTSTVLGVLYVVDETTGLCKLSYTPYNPPIPTPTATPTATATGKPSSTSTSTKTSTSTSTSTSSFIPSSTPTATATASKPVIDGTATATATASTAASGKPGTDFTATATGTTSAKSSPVKSGPAAPSATSTALPKPAQSASSTPSFSPGSSPSNLPSSTPSASAAPEKAVITTSLLFTPPGGAGSMDESSFTPAVRKGLEDAATAALGVAAGSVKVIGVEAVYSDEPTNKARRMEAEGLVLRMPLSRLRMLQVRTIVGYRVVLAIVAEEAAKSPLVQSSGGAVGGDLSALATAVSSAVTSVTTDGTFASKLVEANPAALTSLGYTSASSFTTAVKKDPTRSTSVTTTKAADSKASEGLSGGAIAGIIIAAIVVIAAAAAGAFYINRTAALRSPDAGTTTKGFDNLSLNPQVVASGAPSAVQAPPSGEFAAANPMIRKALPPI